MKVFVTGGSGYIGSVTTSQLLDAGNEVCIFDNLEYGHREAIDPRTAFVEGDLRDPATILNAMREFRPDAVIHFAAYALVGESMEQPERYFINNVTGGLNLIEAMRDCGTRRIVFSSTCATYGQPESVPITEDTPQRPTNPYGQSKLIFEQMLDWYRQIHRFEPIFLRYFNACGASATRGEDHKPESHLIPIVLQAALGQREKVMIFGDDYATPDGTCIRDYIHVEDLAGAHLLALETGSLGAFNLGTGHGYSVREVVEKAREVTGIDIPAEIAPRRPGDPDELVAAPGRANSELGWTPERSDLGTIIETAWKWHKAHPNGYSS